MKKLIFSFFLMISIGFAQQSPTIIISGTLPAIEDTYVRLSYQQMGSYETMEIPVIDGQFKMEVPNLEAGVYRVVLTWPRSEKNRLYQSRDKTGVVVDRDLGASPMNVIKPIYINPDQSTQYFLKLEKDVPEAVFRDLNNEDLITDIFRIKVISSSMDGQLYEMLDSLKKGYNNAYANCNTPHSLDHGFSMLS